MFRQQINLLQALPVVREIMSRYPSWKTQDSGWLDAAEAQARHFMVPVPLVGAFSAGKSSLINAVVGSWIGVIAFPSDFMQQSSVSGKKLLGAI